MFEDLLVKRYVQLDIIFKSFNDMRLSLSHPSVLISLNNMVIDTSLYLLSFGQFITLDFVCSNCFPNSGYHRVDVPMLLMKQTPKPNKTFNLEKCTSRCQKKFGFALKNRTPEPKTFIE